MASDAHGRIHILEDRAPGGLHRQLTLCVEIKQCGLCRFSISQQLKTKIVAITPDGRHSTPFQLKWRPSAPDHRDRELKVSFKACAYRFCGHSSGKATACHAECAEIASRFELTLANFLPVTHCSYQPLALESTRRRKSIELLLQQALGKKFGRLSTELWSMVTADEDLVRCYAIAEIPVNRQQTVYTINPSAAVWSTYVSIDGIEYVSSLSNRPSAGGRLVWDDSPLSDHILYMSEDCLGIRQIIKDPKAAHPTDNLGYSAWWRTFPATSELLSFKTDRFKVRETSCPALYPQAFWPFPMTPTKLYAFDLYYADWGYGETKARMTPFDLNEPGTTGYSACWVNDELVSLYAHKERCGNKRNEEMLNKGQAQYHEMEGYKWTHHPLNPGESIEQVWVRGADKHNLLTPQPFGNYQRPTYSWVSTPWGAATYKRPSDLAMALTTNRGRTLIAGSFPKPSSPGSLTRRLPSPRWSCVAKASNASLIRIYFSPSTHGIPLIAAPMIDGNSVDPAPMQVSLCPPPAHNRNDKIYYSSASLKDVVDIIVCSRGPAESIKVPQVTGILFRYANGDQASVGYFRLGQADPPIAVNESSYLSGAGLSPG
ncbi:hypothetical protein FZEAL_5261 [Fusarium zealandicum]|uniref:Uncharacterized protein n=1 Tax=Fusarium zealandicum TaxID=1053134 RepID=A0A8H4UKR9_9HYPO|nr:hypothetical protein FZEAL_5261 [Fusarium zealandicum]